jgi:hypothetical protein
MHESKTLKLRISRSNILVSQAWFQIEWSGRAALVYPIHLQTCHVTLYSTVSPNAFACVLNTIPRILDRLMQIQNTQTFIWQNEKYASPFTFNPITMVVCSKASNLVCSSNIRILGSSPHRNTNMLTCSFLCVCVCVCVCVTPKYHYLSL